MAKQVVIATMEETFGEYILNMPKENLKIAALRGRIKLENVQLDGDMIGSHVLGALGLQSYNFGILSCSVKSIHIHVPWNSLEHEPTVVKMDGIHMVCVPLVPLTAPQLFGSGTKGDPVCSLRTRLKRLLLARLERNFWNGLYAEEGGPPMKKIQRAVDEVKRDLQQKQKNRSKQQSEGEETDVEFSTEDEDEWLFQSDGSKNDLPELPRDWKVKMREKMMRNMEASMHNVHVRVEVAEKALDFNTPYIGSKHKGGDSKKSSIQQTDQPQELLPEERAFSFGFTMESLVVRTASEEWKVGSHDTRNPLDGTQMSSVKGHLGPNEFMVENNKIGYFSNLSMYWDDEPPILLAETSIMRGDAAKKTAKSSLRIASSIMSQKMTPDKWQSLISTAMEKLFYQQEPGKAIRQSLGAHVPSSMQEEGKGKEEIDRPHVYVCNNLQSEIRVRTSDRTEPGPISCSADVMPLNFDFSLRPHQYKQYNLLRSAIQRQQRFDTMLRQRPTESPKQNPRAWWQYAVACVTARPNSRPWEDVLTICRSRKLYMDLARKKNRHRASGAAVSSCNNGYHTGLSESESAELLALEELLPLEALQAFHLLALREAYAGSKKSPSKREKMMQEQKEQHSKPRGLGRFRFRRKEHRRKDSRGSELTHSSTGDRGAPNQILQAAYSTSEDEDDNDSYVQNNGEQTNESFNRRRTQSEATVSSQTSFGTNHNSMSLMQAMTMRLGNKAWFIDWRFHDVRVNFGLTVDGRHLASLNLRTRGNVRSFGRGKRDYCFDVAQCDVIHQNQKILYVKNDDGDVLPELVGGDDDYDGNYSSHSLSSELNSISSARDHEPDSLGGKLPTIQALLRDSHGKQLARGIPDLKVASSYLDLPPTGVVCRIVAGTDRTDTVTQKISIASHPLTFLWTSSFLDGVQNFHKSNPDIGLHVRNAATPLARKAQLALLSPGSRSIHLNVVAPKVWFPIIAKNEPGGTLVLDSGSIRLEGEKEEGNTDMALGFRASDIQAKFIRRAHRGGGMPIQTNGSDVGAAFFYWHTQSAAQTETSVIQPFSVSVNAETLSRIEKKQQLQKQDGTNFQFEDHNGPLRRTEINVTPICMNLVDAEILARALGRLYAKSVAASRSRTASQRRPRQAAQNVEGNQTNIFPILIDRTRQLIVNIERMEIALEGHSRRKWDVDCDKSMASLDSFHESSPSIRAYLLQIEEIQMNRTSHGLMAATQLQANNAFIVRLAGGVPFRNKRRDTTSLNSHDRILVRSGTEDQDSAQPVFRAGLLHDGKNHLDEVEVDIDSVILRVTTTTLKDCTKAVRRVAEVTQILGGELERKVHEEGRKARRREGREHSLTDQHGIYGDRPPSPTLSMATDFHPPLLSKRTPSDSSILFRITLNESTLLAGRPTGAILGSPMHSMERKTSFAVIQLLSRFQIMFQSIENPDGTGSKTLHVSVDNASSIVNTEFERVPPSQAPPMVGPTGAEFRIVYATENLGCVVSQDIALDCEEVKICVTPNDFSIMLNISKSMIDRLKEISGPSSEESFVDSAHRSTRAPLARKEKRSLSSLVRYQKKGAGIATSVRAEVHAVSFVLLKSFKSYLGSPEFLNFCMSDMKASLEGCVSALTGEASALLSVNYFNSDSIDWEYAMEPVQFVAEVDQMPNELVIHLSSKNMIQLNLTGLLLRELADLKFDFNRDRSSPDRTSGEGLQLNPAAMSTLGLRRATEARSVKVRNLTGFDVHVIPDSMPFGTDTGLVKDGQTSIVEAMSSSQFNSLDSDLSFNLRVSASADKQIGDREAIYDLPVKPSATQEAKLYLLRHVQPAQSSDDGRASPETVITEESASDHFLAEPVVEYCMHNQRMSSLVSDVYSTPRGCDILSGSAWSPSDESVPSQLEVPSVTGGVVSPKNSPPNSPSRELSKQKSYWVRPHQSDSPEWTDMTCTLRMALERVMLPDHNWVWANDWTVDIGGKLGEETDADGWEYQTDFEAFTRKRRDYQRGDSCRRRRWTRVRMVQPPRLEDISRPLKFVWDSSKDERGNVCVEIRSNLRIVNVTSSTLSFYLSSPSWKSEMPTGSAEAGGKINVPVALSSAVYMKIGRGSSTVDVIPEDGHGFTDNILIIPLSSTSSNFIRTAMDLGDVSGTVLHFLVEIRSERGIVDIVVQPILKVVNLLPCSIECQIGELLEKSDDRNPDIKPAIGKRGKPITMTETMPVESGGEAKFTAVNPWRKPHVSFRVPGYKWSLWQRIINRPRSAETWRPSDAEDAWHYMSKKSDADFADEYKTIVHFERWTKNGDPLLLLMSFECGHCPIVRLYAQYWILDKTQFSCHFTEGFEDLMGSIPDKETSRKSFLPLADSKDSMIRKDMKLPGHQWSLGNNGMSLYFSRRERLSFAVEANGQGGTELSRWSNPLDISNVMPKTVVTLEEYGGSRAFEFAISVNVCPGIFSRTRLITLMPRYQIINLLHRELVVAQEGCLDSSSLIPSQSSIPFHWEKSVLPPTVRFGTPFYGENLIDGNRWTNGGIHLDRIGITSMRIPTDTNLTKIPMVVQTEVRLASKEQHCAVVIVVWSAHEKMNNPLYTLRNTTPYTILCRQPLQDEQGDGNTQDQTEIEPLLPEPCSSGDRAPDFHCGQTDFGPMILSFLGLDKIQEFVWIVGSGEVVTFGFDDPEKAHLLEWTCVNSETREFDEGCPKAFVEVDAMGSSSTLAVTGGKQIKCHIVAEYSTKVIEFTEVFDPTLAPSSGGQILDSLRLQGEKYSKMLRSEGVIVGEAKTTEEEEDVGVGFRVDLPGVSVSVVDNSRLGAHGREILLGELDKLYLSFCQTREGYQEIEMRLNSFQVDNHVQKSIHPVLIFCPPLHENEPLLHFSAVRRLQAHSNTFVFRYAAIRLLDIDIFLDRRTAEKVATFIEPLLMAKELEQEDPALWASQLTSDMEKATSQYGHFVPDGIESTLHNSNSGRIYFEQLHLHPVRLSLTFTQEWSDWDKGVDSIMLLQFIRGMASIANAPLTFTSFVVSHVFEAPQALGRVVATHYSSQLTKQIFNILGSLAILTAPADFISNVGTGVRDFFYEPINGAVHGPRQFIEGLEAGTQSLARGVFVGVVRGAANVTELVNANLVGLTADEEFIDERKAHQRLLTDALSRGTATRTFGDSLHLAGASVARSFKSGALGIFEQPAMYASRHGPIGFLKGMGKAIVGAVVKPVVGVGDAAVLVMNHVSDATSTKRILPKIPKRLRRALPNRSAEKLNCVRLLPYDERAAKAQKIVTGGENVDDVYYGHLQIPSHLIITSQQCLWAIDRRSKEPWCANWEEVSHFIRVEGGVRVIVFSKTGLKSYTFHVENKDDASKLYDILSMHSEKMGNSAESNTAMVSTKPESLSRHHIPGVKARQVNYIFGSCNTDRSLPENAAKDEVTLVEQCFSRVKRMGSESSTFFKNLDEEAWLLVTTWGQLFTGLSSKRCLVAGLINGTGRPIQIKTSKLLEGGSPCYTIPTKEFDPVHGVLHSGGCILFFGWGVAPTLLQDGNVFMNLETNGFVSNLATFKSRDTFATAMPGYEVGFLEKSMDENNWWAKYWLVVRSSQ